MVTMTAASGVLLVTFLIGAVYGESKSSSVTKMVGQDVTLTCRIQNLSTYPTWVKQTRVDHGEDTSVSLSSRSLRMSTRDQNDNSSLLLMNLTLDDSGNYTCSVPGQGNHTITLTVIQPAESWKQAVVGFVVTILSFLPGVFSIVTIVCYYRDFRRKDKSGDRTACWICACLGWSFLLFIASAVSTWFCLTRSGSKRERTTYSAR
ncbi:uncharacterized protein LOC128241848 [Mya arenaria]|uniref:uncharacterized protein LOC128241848 n=1 Tax=Mya arenaria TaxID=6604 RepID=UPI0022E1437D|nr:uncharacterized protein LOC128241848 [Mya arenaria]XP_052814914.1 uncharacterized protein LOC128241848 [Mya arenaria]